MTNGQLFVFIDVINFFAPTKNEKFLRFSGSLKRKRKNFSFVRPAGFIVGRITTVDVFILQVNIAAPVFVYYPYFMKYNVRREKTPAQFNLRTIEQWAHEWMNRVKKTSIKKFFLSHAFSHRWAREVRRERGYFAIMKKATRRSHLFNNNKQGEKGWKISLNNVLTMCLWSMEWWRWCFMRSFNHENGFFLSLSLQILWIKARILLETQVINFHLALF